MHSLTSCFPPISGFTCNTARTFLFYFHATHPIGGGKHRALSFARTCFCLPFFISTTIRFPVGILRRRSDPRSSRVPRFTLGTKETEI